MNRDLEVPEGFTMYFMRYMVHLLKNFYNNTIPEPLTQGNVNDIVTVINCNYKKYRDEKLYIAKEMQH